MQGIVGRVEHFAADNGLHLLFVVEAGSRAWGLASEKSDYDVRGVFVRPTKDYIVGGKSEQLELKDDAQGLDLVLWDARKALKLLAKGNGTVREWLASPIVYIDAFPALTRAWRGLVCELDCTTHYARLLKSERRRHLGGRREVQLAEYLHALRPALLAETAFARSLDVETLLDDSLMSSEAREFCLQLVHAKQTGEALGEGRHCLVLDSWMDMVEKQVSKTNRFDETIANALLVQSVSVAEGPAQAVIRVGLIECHEPTDSVGRSFGKLIRFPFVCISNRNLFRRACVGMAG